MQNLQCILRLCVDVDTLLPVDLLSRTSKAMILLLLERPSALLQILLAVYTLLGLPSGKRTLFDLKPALRPPLNLPVGRLLVCCS